MDRSGVARLVAVLVDEGVDDSAGDGAQGSVGLGVEVGEARRGFMLDELVLVVGVMVADVGAGGQRRLLFQAQRGCTADTP